ncbi:MAG: hypothetical protein U0232_32720 [Thermomicrobiales bacterium]
MDEATERRTLVGYHGTSIISVPTLLRGVATQAERNFPRRGQLGIGFYATNDYPMAVEFARVAVRVVGGYRSVINVYARQFDTLIGLEVPQELWWNIADDSPYVTDVDYLTSAIDGYPEIRQTKFNPRAYHALIVELPS